MMVFVIYQKNCTFVQIFKIGEKMQIGSNILTPQTRLVVLDLDGTLYAKSRMAWRMLCSAPNDWKRMLAERKTRKQLRGKWLQNEELFYQTYFQTLANYCKSTPEEIRVWYMNRYMPLMVNVIRKYYKPVEWLIPFAAECKKKDIRLIVLSDYGHTNEKLNALNINTNIFDWVISAPELGGLKPAPQLLEKVAERMGVTLEECLVVGDREDTDIALAKAVGAAFFLVSNL